MIMGALLTDILSYVWHVLLATFFHLFIFLGPLLFLAFIMHLVAQKNEKLSYQVMGKKIYLYGFAWLGTAVHELGHALFAIIFRHKITEMVLFSPKAKDGSLGHVNHSYNKKSTYQRIGNFFIGIGPILLGSIVLYFISWLFFGFGFSSIQPYLIDAEQVFSWSNLGILFGTTWENLVLYAQTIFFGPKTNIIKIIIFIYIVYSIGSSITLSKADISGSTEGFKYLVISLFIFNLLSSWMGEFMMWLVVDSLVLFSGFYFLIILSIVINLIFIGVLKLLATRLRK